LNCDRMLLVQFQCCERHLAYVLRFVREIFAHSWMRT
jgi:hypothetical protein